MIELFKPLKKLFKIDLQEPNTDNNVFRLHYRFSVLVLLGCATLVGWKEYIGDPILCMSEDKLPEKVINAYCWISATFTLPNRNMQRIGKDIASPGVAQPFEGEELKFAKYYQWVFLALFLQALLFKVPHTLWKICENGRMKSMVKDLDQPIMTEECRRDRQQLLVDHLTYNFGRQNNYFYRFLFCEILNFVNVVGQIYFMDMFLDGDFMNYGTQVMDCANEKYSDECTNPMSRIFPKVSKCDFYKFGPSGTVEQRDALCVLSINVINEKIYIFLWFWFMTVAAVSGLMLVYRVGVVASVKIRVYLLRSRAEHASLFCITSLVRKGKVGDWFILYQLSRNIDNRVFVELLSDLSKELFPERSSARQVEGWKVPTYEEPLKQKLTPHNENVIENAIMTEQCSIHGNPNLCPQRSSARPQRSTVVSVEQPYS